MTDAVADLVREVLDLARAERDEVIEAVLASLEGSDTVNRAWVEDARRRFEAIRSGEAGHLDRDDIAASFEDELPPAWEDPIVAEVHRIREELLEEFGGDMDAMREDANRRLLAGEYGDFKVVRFPPRRPPGWREPDLPDAS